MIRLAIQASFVLSFFLLNLSSASLAQEAVPLRMGTLTIDMPAGWRIFPEQNRRIEGRGPGDERLIVNYRVVRADATPEDAEQHRKIVRGIGTDLMPSVAAKSGMAVRPILEKPLPDRRVQYSGATQKVVDERAQYMVQYMLASTRLVSYITIEGTGNAAQAAERFDAVIATQRWEE